MHLIISILEDTHETANRASSLWRAEEAHQEIYVSNFRSFWVLAIVGHSFVLQVTKILLQETEI